MAANLFRKISRRIPSSAMAKLLNIWRPFRGAGIRVADVSEDLLYIKVELVLRWFNRNYVGTQFGGSLYAMTDPFYMFQLIEALGQDYIVWDKAACIKFIRPGKTKVYAEFRFTQEEIAEIKKIADSQEKYVFDKDVSIYDINDEIVAHVTKTLYVRKKS